MLCGKAEAGRRETRKVAPSKGQLRVQICETSSYQNLNTLIDTRPCHLFAKFSTFGGISTNPLFSLLRLYNFAYFKSQSDTLRGLFGGQAVATGRASKDNAQDDKIQGFQSSFGAEEMLDILQPGWTLLLSIAHLGYLGGRNLCKRGEAKEISCMVIEIAECLCQLHLKIRHYLRRNLKEYPWSSAKASH